VWQGGNVLASVGWSVCQQDVWESYVWMFMKWIGLKMPCPACVQYNLPLSEILYYSKHVLWKIPIRDNLLTSAHMSKVCTIWVLSAMICLCLCRWVRLAYIDLMLLVFMVDMICLCLCRWVRPAYIDLMLLVFSEAGIHRPHVAGIHGRHDMSVST